MIKPTGKTMAPIVRMRPGALVWNHGAVLVESASAHPKEIRQPPMKELTNILSIRMRAFLAPMRETSSVVCCVVISDYFELQEDEMHTAGVNASMIAG